MHRLIRSVAIYGRNEETGLVSLDTPADKIGGGSLVISLFERFRLRESRLLFPTTNISDAT